jgi:hypothetical protein
LLRVAVDRRGIIKGPKAVAYIAQWCVTSTELGRPATAEEVAASWGESRATGYRWQQDFRAAFPEWDTPEPVWDQVRERMAKLERRTVGAAMEVVSGLPA